jgi:hypothetical protein
MDCDLEIEKIPPEMNTSHMKRLEEIRELARRAALETTGHGLPRIISIENRVLKVLWLLAILASVCGCSYMFFDGIRNFLEWNVVTSIKKIPDSPALFPVRM